MALSAIASTASPTRCDARGRSSGSMSARGGGRVRGGAEAHLTGEREDPLGSEKRGQWPMRRVTRPAGPHRLYPRHLLAIRQTDERGVVVRELIA
jgi:hypothetical protein